MSLELRKYFSDLSKIIFGRQFSIIDQFFNFYTNELKQIVAYQNKQNEYQFIILVKPNVQ